MPLEPLPKFLDFRFVGPERSSLQTLAQICRDDSDATDVAERIEALDRASAKEILMAQLVVRIL